MAFATETCTKSFSGQMLMANRNSPKASFFLPGSLVWGTISATFRRKKLSNSVYNPLVTLANKISQIKQADVFVTDVNFLFILDNADGDDKAELLKEFWPGTNPKWSVLITSRDQTLTPQLPGLELTELDEDSAVDLLLNLTSQKRVRMSEQSVQEEQYAAK